MTTSDEILERATSAIVRTQLTYGIAMKNDVVLLADRPYVSDQIDASRFNFLLGFLKGREVGQDAIEVVSEKAFRTAIAEGTR